MSTSIISGDVPIESSFAHKNNELEIAKYKFSDHEFIDALISLADMLDAANDKTELSAESLETSAAREYSESEERFSFLSGWDRLIVRFRDNCTNRKTFIICF